MKVLFVHEGYVAKKGNVFLSNAYTNENILRYRVLGENITFLTRTKELSEYKNWNILDVEGFSFIGVDNYRNLKEFTKYKKVKSVISEAVKNSDYIVARLPSDMGSTAVMYAKKYNKKYIIELVGCPWDSLWNHSFYGKFLAPIMKLTTRKIVKKSPYVIYVTKEYLQLKYPTRGKSTNCSNVSLNGVLSKEVENRLNKIEMMDDNQKKIIGTIGAIDVRYKGQEYVIRAIAELKKEGFNNYTYQLIGGGNNKYLKSVALENNLDKEVEFLGPLTHEHIFKWLENIDIYIQPSLTEGLPRSLIEAMSYGLPSIGSNVGGIPELIDLEYLFKSKSVEEIKTKIIFLNKENMKKASKNNFERAEEYRKRKIEIRRDEFFLEFMQS